MFVLFSPFTFLFLIVYFIVFLSCFISPSFLALWVEIEIMILVFLGVSFTLFSSSLSYLILYFIIQVFSSFGLLVFYLLGMPLLLTISSLLKLSMFPFHYWFVALIPRFPYFTIFLSSSAHNVPFFLLVVFFNLPLHQEILIASILLTTLLSGFAMLNFHSPLYVIIASSISTNSWFFISSLCSLDSFIQFFLIYSSSLLLLLISLTSSSKLLNLHFLLISGLPPFPLFFANAFVIISSFFWCLFSPYYIIFFLFANSVVFIGYIYYTFKYFTVYFSPVI